MITPQDIADACNAAGIDTAEKLAQLIALGTAQLEIGKLDNQIEALAQARAAAVYSIDQQRVQLESQRATLVASLSES